jgi:hypothetical protein
MVRWLPGIVAVLMLGLGAAALSVAQEEEPAEPTPSGQPEEPADGEEPDPAAFVEKWVGEVHLKKAEAEDFEILAPVGEDKPPLYAGDTVSTAEGAKLVLNFVDGTIIELGSNSELIIEKNIEGSIVVRLVRGEADITFGSDSFEFICARHTITGKDSRVQVNSPDPNTISIFGIEDGAVIENEYGHIFYLGRGQKMEAAYLEDEAVFQVTVHEFNEKGLNIEVNGEYKMIDPGVSFTIDADGVIKFAEPVPPVREGKPAVVPELPLVLEKTEDEPIENTGDLKPIYMVSPKKP